MLGNFDKFLSDGLFMSIEGDTVNYENLPESAIMGAIPNHPLIADTMKFYQDNAIFPAQFRVQQKLSLQVGLQNHKFQI